MSTPTPIESSEYAESLRELVAAYGEWLEKPETSLSFPAFDGLNETPKDGREESGWDR
jgi:hypothetical protein